MLPQQVVLLWTYLRSHVRAAGGWNEAGTVVEKVILTASLRRPGHCRRCHHREQGHGQSQLHQFELRSRLARRRSPSGNDRTWWDDGSAVVEAVLVIPVAMLLLMMVVQLALWAHAAQVVQLAASEGDQVARTTGGNVAAGEARAASVLSASGSVVISATSAVVSIGSDAQATIKVTGRAEAVLPWLVLPVTATQIGPVQGFRASG